jgi:cell division protein FtsA
VNGKSHPAGVRAAVHAGGTHTNGATPGHAAGHEHDSPVDSVFTQQDEMLEALTFEGSTRLIPRNELNEVMAARLDQLFGMVGDEIRRSGYEGLLPAGVVLTGGVASMPGIEALASHKLRMPVRVGRPQRIGGLADAFDSPAYATSVGLTLWGIKESAQMRGARGVRPSRSQKGQEAKNLLAKWLKGFLPQG